MLNSLENCTLINYGHLNWSCYNVGKMQLKKNWKRKRKKSIAQKTNKNNQIGGMAPTREHYPMTHKGNQSNWLIYVFGNSIWFHDCLWHKGWWGHRFLLNLSKYSFSIKKHHINQLKNPLPFKLTISHPFSCTLTYCLNIHDP